MAPGLDKYKEAYIRKRVDRLQLGLSIHSRKLAWPLELVRFERRVQASMKHENGEPPR